MRESTINALLAFFVILKVYCDFHGHSRKKNVFMYGCSTAATIAASSSSSGGVESGLVGSVRERVADLSGSDPTSSMDPSDIDEDPGYRVRLWAQVLKTKRPLSVLVSLDSSVLIDLESFKNTAFTCWLFQFRVVFQNIAFAHH